MNNSKINLLISQYEKFEMTSNESIVIYFQDQYHSDLSQVTWQTTHRGRDCLKGFKESTWEAKVTAIREAKNLDTLGLDQLMGSLLTNEIERK